MDIQLNLPDRICGQCKETKGYLHFLPATPYNKTWNTTCSACRNSTIREALPDLPFLPCALCRKPRPLTAFVVSLDGNPSIGNACYACRMRGAREAKKEGGGDGEA